MACTFEFVLHFVRCVTVTVSPNQIIINIIIMASGPMLRYAISRHMHYDGLRSCNGMFSDAVYILILIVMSLAPLASYMEASFIVN